MNCVFDILGVAILPTKARAAVMSQTKCRREAAFSQASATGFFNYAEKSKSDDDTASTVSTSEQDEFFSSSVVTFSETLVTHVYTRPRTTKEEKRVLFYTDDEYMEFRLDAHCSRRRNRVVKFADSIVTDVYDIPSSRGKANLYYSEAELQEFLDEFVASLDVSSEY